MYKIASECMVLKVEFGEILMNINIFEFEDRKHVQQFVSELYNQYQEVIEEALAFKKEELVSTLVSKYDMPGLSPFVGQLLRLFTKSNRLVEAFLNIDIL